MDRPDLPLNALRVFEVAMRQGSFTKAAIELRVTQAAVSHQVARLEDLLGAALFLRTSQGLVPTDEGRLLFPAFTTSPLLAQNGVRKTQWSSQTALTTVLS